jgi:hypothetical protein
MAKSPRTTKSAPPSTPKATTSKKSPAPDATRASTPNGSDDAIARRAYEIYQARGGDHGADVDDWLQAEREIRSRR